MAKDNKSKNKEKRKLKQLEKISTSIDELDKGLSTKVFNNNNESREELNGDIKNMMNTVNGMINHAHDISNGDLINAIADSNNKFSNQEREQFNAIKESLESNNQFSSLSNLYSGNGSFIEKHEDLELIAKLVPQLAEARKAIRDQILSPDDFTKELALNLTINNNDIKNNDMLNNKMNKIFKDYKLSKKLKNIIDKTLIHGACYVSVINYKDFFAKVLKDKKESLDTNKISESVITYNSNEIESLDALEDNTETINKKLVETVNDIEFEKGGSSLLYDEKDFLIDALNEGILFDNNKKDMKKYNNLISNDGLYNNKGSNYDYGVPNVSGCVLKILDIRKIIPVKINDIIFGYYYIENSETEYFLKDINNPMDRFKFKNDADFNKSLNTVDVLVSQLSTLIMKRINKKYIEKNQEIKQSLYEIIKTNNILDSKNIKVTFLKPDEVVKFAIETEEGESIYEQTLFFSKLYLAILISSIMLQISRGNDKRAYYIKQNGLSPDVAKTINYAIREIKKDQRSLLDINNINRLVSVVGKFTDLFIPMGENGEKPIDIDVIAGQDGNIKSELLEMLENIIVNGTGMPSALLDYSNEVDFAKTLTMLNSKVLKRILSLQLDLKDSTTEFIKKILLSESNEDEINDIKSLEASYQTPLSMSLLDMIDKINNAKDFANNIVTSIKGEDVDSKLLSNVALKVIKSVTPSINWELYEEYVKQSEMEIVDNKSDEQQEM